MRGVLRHTGTIARLGGDEFAAIVPCIEPQAVPRLARELLQLFQIPYEVQGQPVVVGASIGIALFPEHGLEPEALLRRADVAMYVAKCSGEGFAFYEPCQDQNSPDRLTMIGDLRRAVDQGELVLHYQPKIELSTGGLDGVEALVRWQHPMRGLIAPDQFIAVAEQAGLIDALSQWVLRAALRQCRAWRRGGLDIPVAINLSPRNLHDQRLPDTIAKLLAQHKLPPHLLGLAELKIDRSFIRDIVSDEGDRLIVRTTVELAHSFGLRVMAEGVEDDLTKHLLTELGCDVGQGFHMSRPLPGPEVTHWLHEQLSTQRAA